MDKVTKTILAVDDNHAILDALNEVLSFGGYDVITLSDGRAVFDAIEKVHPDLILLDVMLNNIDGREICQAIKNCKDTNHIPVIMISASHNLQDLFQAPGAPDDFIAKPFDIHYLLRKIDTRLSAAA